MKHPKRLVLCIIGVFLIGLVSWKMTEERRLDKAQENAVALAQQEEGKYNAEQIVLEDTTKGRAEEFLCPYLL